MGIFAGKIAINMEVILKKIQWAQIALREWMNPHVWRKNFIFILLC